MAPVCGLPAKWRAIIRQPGGIYFARRGATISEARTLRAIAVRHFDEGAEPSPRGRSSGGSGVELGAPVIKAVAGRAAVGLVSFGIDSLTQAAAYKAKYEPGG